MSISRRELLRRAGYLGAVSLLPTFSACAPDKTDEGEDEAGDGTGDGTGDETADETGGDDGLPSYEWEGELGPETLFEHGVASGDPLADAVVLWTRLSTGDSAPAESFFEVALTPDFEQRVLAAWIDAVDGARDFTVKIDVTGLEAGTTYYYRFWAMGRSSPIGRTRTAALGPSAALRFAVCSCASLAHGYFHAYRGIAERPELDAVLHLGDYIYEFATGEYGDVREYEPPHELVTLDDYRLRYSQYRRDADLAECHRQHPFIVTWDDHEIANDAWPGGAANHDPDTEGPWSERKAAALQAYFEWMPIREARVDQRGRIHRSFRFGDLADLIMLDTRLYGRDRQVSGEDPALADPERSLLGAEQEAWLARELQLSAEARVPWRLLGQQVMVGQVLDADRRPTAPDTWSGYPAARGRLLRSLREASAADNIILTGDVHSSWAIEIHEDPWEDDTRPVAVELVTPAVTSPGPVPDDEARVMEAQLPTHHPHIKWLELRSRGYVLLEVEAEVARAQWWHVETVDERRADERLAQTFEIKRGRPRLISS